MDVANMSNERIEEIFDKSIKWGVTFEEAIELDELRESIRVSEDTIVNNQWVDLDTELDFSGQGAEERDEIIDRFTFHPPKEGQGELYEAIRHSARDMAVCVRDLCPDGREKSLALTKLEEASFWANAAIARA